MAYGQRTRPKSLLVAITSLSTITTTTILHSSARVQQRYNAYWVQYSTSYLEYLVSDWHYGSSITVLLHSTIVNWFIQSSTMPCLPDKKYVVVTLSHTLQKFQSPHHIGNEQIILYWWWCYGTKIFSGTKKVPSKSMVDTWDTRKNINFLSTINLTKVEPFKGWLTMLTSNVTWPSHLQPGLQKGIL